MGMKKRAIRVFTGYIVVLVWFCSVFSQGEDSVYGVPMTRINRLRRGTCDAVSLRSCPSESWFENFKNKGYECVKCNISPSVLYSRGSTTPKGEGITLIKECARMCKKYDLGCYVELHKTKQERVHLYEESGFADYCEKLAAKLRDEDPEYLYLGIIYTPSYRPDQNSSSEDWDRLQNKAVRQMREAAPDHTIILAANTVMVDTSWKGGSSGLNWDNVDNLMEMKIPEPEIQNIVVSFLDFAPKVFTYQGSDYLTSWMTEINNLKYPMEIGNTNVVLSRAQHADAKQSIRDYVKIGWNAEVFLDRYKMVAEWRESVGGVYCINSSFGADPDGADEESKKNYYADIVAAMNHYQVGWITYWDYDAEVLGLDTALPPYDKNNQSPVVIIRESAVLSVKHPRAVQSNRGICFSPSYCRLRPEMSWYTIQGRFLGKRGDDVFPLRGAAMNLLYTIR
jgi:hypothetical protein